MIDILIEEEAWLAAAPDCEAWVERAVAGVLACAEAFGENPSAAGGEVTVVLDADAPVAELNQQFLGKSGPTNVLSFPAPHSARPHLGDVILAFGVCAREAEGQGKSLQHHLAHLTVHGVLHLLGWDHLTDAEAEDMERLERDILGGLSVLDPYLDPRDV